MPELSYREQIISQILSRIDEDAGKLNRMTLKAQAEAEENKKNELQEKLRV